MIKFYTDGSCKGNGKKEAVGGWAYVILKNDEKIYEESGYEKNTTNNRMEMLAVINALEKFGCLEGHAEIYTDSAYIHNCIEQKWYINWQNNGWVTASRTPVKNKELWERLIPFFDNPRYTFYKVKGHADNQWNNLADKLATSAAAEGVKE